MQRAPIVGTFHAAGQSSSYQIFYWFLKWAVGHIDRKVVVSKDALELVQSHLGGEYDILFNGVEIDEIASAPPTPTTRPTIFFCGRHEERKGLAVLLEAFTTLADDVHLWIASDGPDGPRLRQQYAGNDRITWLGRISDAEKFARLRGATVFCAPSLHGESFGVVLIEAMAAGTPVVASGIDGYRNVATDGVDALLVEPGDAGALAAAISSVLGDTALAATAACRRAPAGEGLLDAHPRRRVRPHLPPTADPDGSGTFQFPLSGHNCVRTRQTLAMTVALIILAVLVVLLIVYLIAAYNGLIRRRNQIENAWSQIDVQLKRRLDLIPNLVETVKGYAAHERETLDAVIKARNSAIAAPSTPHAQAEADSQLSGALRQVFALGEAYPDLKANQNFLALQEELTATEGRVAYARQFYNDSVLDYNNKLQQVPTVFYARMLKFEPREYFEADEAARTVPTVEF